MKEYALYKGEEFITVGTIKEIAEEMDMTERKLRYFGLPCYIKRLKENHNSRILITLDEMEV